MSEKMMSFEEWKDCNWIAGAEEFKRKLFDTARSGMIPAENAIVVDWGNAPKHADSASIIFGRMDEGWGDVTEHYEPQWFIGPIPRPVPAWTPKVDDLVFFLDHKNHVDIGKILTDGTDGSNPSIRRSRNVDYYTQVKDIKPFSASKIGLPWEEI